jgi:hypothetical protein
MAKSGSNWIWWTIGGVSLLGLGVGAYIFFKDRKDKRDQSSSESDTPSPSPSPSSDSSSSSSSLPDTPFKNQAEGDAFRAWLNDNYSDYARSIDLSRKGVLPNAYNNPTIKKGWKQYGSAYTNRSTTPQSTTSNPTRTLESIANSLRDGGLVQDVVVEAANNRVRGFAYDGFGLGSNNIYVNLYPNGTLYFEDGNNSRKKSGTFSGASPNMTIEVEGAKLTGKGGIIANELGKSLYANASFSFHNSNDFENLMNNSKVCFIDPLDENL